jgi:phage terminase large subunit-like protein
LVFPPTEDAEKYQVLPFFWIPKDTIAQRVRCDHVMYDVWEKRGFIQTTEGTVVHYDYIEKAIDELGKIYNIKEIAVDRWNATHLTQDLQGMGFTMVPFGQDFKEMSSPTKELMKLTLEHKLAHGGHPVLRWMMYSPTGRHGKRCVTRSLT